MTPRELFEAIGLVDDAFVLEADATVAATPRPRLAVARRWVPLAACLCLVVGGALLAVRGGVLGGGMSGGVMAAPAADNAAPRTAEAADAGAGQADAGAAPPDAMAAAPQEPADAPAGEGADGLEGAAESAVCNAAPQDAATSQGTAGAAGSDGAAEPGGTAGDADAGKSVCGIGRVDGTGNVMYWGSQLEPELQAALWADGEPEPWQDVLAALPAEAQPGAAPATLPVLRDGKSIGQYAVCSQTDAQALLFAGSFLSAEGVPRGGTNPANALDAELVYNPAGAALRVPMWAFTVPTDMACGDVVCYVPAVDLETLRQLVSDPYGG